MTFYRFTFVISLIIINLHWIVVYFVCFASYSKAEYLILIVGINH